MKNFKILYLIFILCFFVFSCTKIKEGFRSQKKNSTDEFLVEKKSPLVMPPEFDKLPLPNTFQNQDENLEENKIKKIIKSTEASTTDNSSNQNKSFENSILEKIKNN